MTVTLPLTLLAAGLMVVTAVPVGVFAATRHRRWGDYLAMTLSQLGVAVPGFWAGLLLVLLFSVKLGWVQSGGFDGWSQGVWRALRSLILPAAALGFFQFAVLARTTRSAVLEVLREEYVKTARAKGVGERGVLFRHALRNAMIPVTTVAGIQLGQLMAGSIVLETVFTCRLGRSPSGPSARATCGGAGVVLFVASMIVLINVASTSSTASSTRASAMSDAVMAAPRRAQGRSAAAAVPPSRCLGSRYARARPDGGGEPGLHAARPLEMSITGRLEGPSPRTGWAPISSAATCSRAS